MPKLMNLMMSVIKTNNTRHSSTAFLISGLVTGMLLCTPAQSVESTEPESETLAYSLGLFVYPEKSQSSKQISQDDYECFGWAKKQTGHDPLSPAPRPLVDESSIEARGGKAAAKDVAGGAAVGAVIGEIGNDDWGEGAAIGGFLGGIRAYRKSKAYKERQRVQAERKIDTQVQYEKLEFKNAFSACLTGRGYAVR